MYLSYSFSIDLTKGYYYSQCTRSIVVAFHFNMIVFTLVPNSFTIDGSIRVIQIVNFENYGWTV